MKQWSKIEISIVSLMVITVIAFLWIFSSNREPAGKTPPPAPEPQKVVKKAPAPLSPLPQNGDAPPQTSPGTEPKAMPPTTDWLASIDDILRNGDDTTEMARKLSTLVKTLSGEGQVEASRHLVNLTPDNEYGLISATLLDPKANPAVVEILYADLMNRSHKLLLPNLLQIIKTPGHPQAEQARNTMSIFAGQDFGTNMAAWDKVVQEKMAELLQQEQAAAAAAATPAPPRPRR